MAGDKEKDLAIDTYVRLIFGNRAKGSWEYQAALRLANQLWDAAIEAAAKIAEHPYRIGQVDGATKPTETGEAIAIEIRYLAGRKP